VIFAKNIEMPSKRPLLADGLEPHFLSFRRDLGFCSLLLDPSSRKIQLIQRRKGVRMIDDSRRQALLPMVTEIVAAHLSNNTVAVGDIPRLINEVYGALTGLGQNGAAAPAEMAQEPAVPIKKSVMPDHIICLEDGKKLKMLKRHLRTAYGLTPEQYREKWNLPSDYPMVAPNYAKKRSSLARQIGLGTGGRRR
jgi:predicted transcriptional regulator